jgi:hypothetical protein
VAFDDALIGSNDFDPRTATEDLIRQQAGEPLPDVLDPRMLNTRLARKLGRKTPPADTEQPSPDLKTEQPKQPKQGDLDFSSQAVPASAVDPTDTSLDFSSQATPVNPEPAPKPLGVTGQLGALGKGLAHGAIEHAGGVVKGLGVAAEHDQTPPIVTEAGLGVDTLNSPWQVPGAPPKDQPAPRANSPLIPAGEATQKAAQTIAPMTDQEKDSIGGRVGTGIGTIAPYAVATAINPALGMAAGFTGMAADTYGQVFDEAKKKGKSDEEADTAAKYSAVTAGVLGTLPLPAAKLATSVMGKIAISGATFMTLGEFQDAILKEIAFHSFNEDYRGKLEGERDKLQGEINKVKADPDLLSVNGDWLGKAEAGIASYNEEIANAGHYSPDAKRIMAALIVGGIAGGMHAGVDAMRKPDVSASAAAPGPGGPGGNLSPSGGGPGGPRSSPEDIADFVKKAKETNPNPQPEAPGNNGTTSGPKPEDMNDAELMDAFTKARDAFDGASVEEILHQGGWMKGSLDHLDDRAKVVEAVKIAQEKAAGTGKFAPENQGAEQAASDKTGQTQTNEAKSGPQQEGLKPEAPTSHLEYAVLREYGYSDEDIGNMSAAQRKREVLDAYAEGIKPGEAMTKHKPPGQAAQENQTAQKKPQSDIPEPSGKRDEPIVPKTAEDIQRAQPVEPKSPDQAQAENYQHAHIELPHLGLTGDRSVSIETGMGQERKGVGEDGKPWSVKLEHAAYGRIKGTRGADGQPLDVFVGPSPLSQQVFVVDQHQPGKGFDEHKIMLGFETPIDALHAYSSSYDDHGKDRIGNVRALSVQEFKDWLKGDTTKALATPSFKTPAPPVPSNVSQHEGTGALSTEAGGSEGASPTVPKETPALDANGAGAGSGAETTTASDSSNNIDQSGSEPVEAHSGHYDAIETALGADADMVPMSDIARAAEILAENDGITPAAAFGQAVIETAVEGGFLTEQEAVQAYGEEAKDILEPGREGASGGGEHAGQEGPAPDQERAGGAEEAGELPRGGEAGGETAERPAGAVEPAADEGEGGHRPVPERAAGQPEGTEHEPTGGNKPAGDKASDTAEKEPAADADESGRVTKLQDAGEKIGGARKDAWGAKGLDASDLEAHDAGGEEEALYQGRRCGSRRTGRRSSPVVSIR